MLTSDRVHQKIKQYFYSLNHQQFEATAALFSTEGRLYPPFEASLQGREKILTYLKRKAGNMETNLSKWDLTPLEGGGWRVDVVGTVKTAHFKVNVGWQFVLTATGEIAEVHIKLLASLKELIKFQQ